MSKLQLVQQAAAPATPAASKGALYIGNETNPKGHLLLPSGADVKLNTELYNASTADQTLSTGADTYVTGSKLIIPTGITLMAGATFRWVFGVSKTNLSTTAPVFHVRAGTLGTTGDTDIITAITGVLQTAAADNGVIAIDLIVRNAGATGNASGTVTLTHNLAATGLANVASWGTSATGANFDFTTAGLNFGVSLNPAGTAVWTVLSCSARAWNFA